MISMHGLVMRSSRSCAASVSTALSCTLNISGVEAAGFCGDAGEGFLLGARSQPA